jgi:outer membrane protein
LPLYQGGLVNSQVKEATYLYQRARKEHERLVRSVERTTRSAYWGVISAIGRVEALQQSVAALELALDGRQKGFRSGLFPSLDVLDGVRDLFRSRRDYARARYDYILNSLRLKQMVGTLSEKDIVAVNQWLAE